MKTLFEKIPLEHATSYTVREFKLPVFDTPMHFHPEFELTYIVSGTGKRVVGDHISDFGPGDMAFIGSDLPHYWHSDKRTDVESGCSHSIVLQFNKDFLGKEFFCVPELSAIGRFLNSASNGLNIDNDLKNGLVERLYRLLKLQGIHGIFEVLLILNELAGSTNHTTLSSEGFIDYPNADECSKINSVCQYIFDHFREDITMLKAASIAKMNPPAFCYFFKKRTRKTFSSFVNDIRIGYSSKLLMTTEQSISEICFSSGFNNLSNFNRRFKEVHKISPTAYRQQFWR